MPTDINSRVTVTINVQDTAITRAGFGTPLILSYHTHYADLVRSYTTLAGMVTDGFTIGEPAYLAASAMLSQSPNMGTFKVGRRSGQVAQDIKLTPTQNDTATYSVKITELDGTVQTASFTSTTSTVAQICTGIQAAFAALGTDWTMTDNVTDVSITADNAGEYAAIHAYTDSGGDLANPLWARDEETVDATIATDLNAIVADDNDFYGLITADCQDGLGIAAAAAWVASNKKFYIATTPDSDVRAGTGIAADLASNSYNRSGVIHTTEPGDYPDAAWMALMFSKTPGSATWAYKTLTGVTVQDYTVTEIGLMAADYCNYYQSLGGVASTYSGQFASARFMDIERGIDWLEAEIQANIVDLLLNAEKIPYNSAGLGQIEAQIKAAFDQGTVNQLLSDDATEAPTVTMPAIGDVSSSDKALRQLTGIICSATFAGAVHTVTMTVNISV